MKKSIQAILAVPISERIGEAFGGKSVLGTGAALVSARVILRSFAGMLALGALAGGLTWLRKHREEDGPEPAHEPAARPAKSKRKRRPADVDADVEADADADAASSD